MLRRIKHITCTHIPLAHNTRTLHLPALPHTHAHAAPRSAKLRGADMNWAWCDAVVHALLFRMAGKKDGRQQWTPPDQCRFLVADAPGCGRSMASRFTTGICFWISADAILWIICNLLSRLCARILGYYITATPTIPCHIAQPLCILSFLLWLPVLCHHTHATCIFP